MNVPAELLAEAAFPDRVAERMARHQVARSNLVLEITEGSLVGDPATAGVICRRLNDAGVDSRSTTSAPDTPRSPTCERFRCVH